MKIIIVPNEPNPNMTGRHYGIAKALVQNGHEVHTIMWDLPHQMNRKDLVKHLFTSLRTRNYSYEDLQMHKIGRLPLFWPYINGWLFKRQLRRLYRELDADIIFAQTYTNETTIPNDLPYIYDLADDYAAPADVYGSAIYKFAFKILGVRKTMAKQCRDALAVTAVSEILCNLARPYNSQVIKLPNGVETDIISKLAASSKQPIHPHSLIYVSGFGPWSQPIKVMQAVQTLRKGFPDITLTLVGEGSEVPAIEQFIAAHDASSYIDYRGFVHDRTEVFKLIQQHAIGLNISEKNKWRDAAHPMKVIEYSALGKKVVSTDLAGVQALNLPNVFMFSNDDELDLQKALHNALLAPDKYHPAINKQIMKSFNWTAIITQLEETIANAKQAAARPQVIHVTPSYPPALGGLEKVVQVLSTTQVKTGLKVSVLTALQPKFGNEFRDSVPVQRFKCFVIANTTIIPSLAIHLFSITSEKFVHLHVTQAFTPEVVWLASRIRGFGYVAHMHLDVPASGMAGFLLSSYKQLILRRVLHGARYVIVFNSDQKLKMSKKYGLALSKIAVIPNGAEDIFYNNTPHKLHAKPRLLFVGRLGYQKNLKQLFNALSGISVKFETTIVGSGELEQELRQLAIKLQLNNITFAGRAEGKKLLGFYKQADIFVLPSVREGMPLVLLEAMAMGLPIIATDVTGNREIIQNGKNGLLVPYGDVLSLQNALLNCFDVELYNRLQHGARMSAEDYSWNILVKRFEPLYRRTV